MTTSDGNDLRAEAATNDEPASPPHLARSLSLRDVVVFGLTYMIPIAPVSVFGVVYNLSFGMVALVYLVAAFATLFTAISYREMANAPTLSGSVYAYVKYGLGARAGFFAGWMILLDYLLVPAMILIILAAALKSQFPEVPQWIWIPIAVGLSTLLNLRRITVSARLNIVFLLIQVVVIAIFLAGTAVQMAKGAVTFSAAPLFNGDHISLTVVFAALPIALVSYIGFDVIAIYKEEARDGAATISRATTIVMAAITLLFVLQVYAAALFVPTPDGFATEDATNAAFYDIAGTTMGPWFKTVMILTGGVIASVSSGLVTQATSARLLYVMAKDRRLPSFLAVVSPKRQVPTRATLAIGALSLAIALLVVGNIELIASLVAFGALSSYILLHLAVVGSFGRRAGASWLWHRISPVVGAAILLVVLYSASPHAQIIGIIWAVLGLIVIASTRRSRLLLPDPEAS